MASGRDFLFDSPMSARRLALGLTLCLLAVPAGGASLAAPAAPDASAAAKKRPKCKAGNNKRKCRCPKGQQLKKNAKGFRCKKKPAPAGQTEPTPGGTGTEPAPGVTPEGPTASAEPETVRNDQALLDALTNAAFYKTYNGGAGYGSYAYNFLPTVLGEVEGRKMYSLRYCTYYVSFVASGSALRENFDGVWLIKEGYTHPSDPGLVTGVLQLYRQGMPQDKIVEAPVAVKGGSAAIKTGDGSQYFEPGDYSHRPGQATTDCRVWEPDSR